MSKNEVYPLDKDSVGSYGIPVELSVNQRLAPIYKALLDGPDGWKQETCLPNLDWVATSIVPRSHHECDHFRLVRKRRTVTVELEGILGAHVIGAVSNSVCITFPNNKTALKAAENIRKAMEGK